MSEKHQKLLAELIRIKRLESDRMGFKHLIFVFTKSEDVLDNFKCNLIAHNEEFRFNGKHVVAPSAEYMKDFYNFMHTFIPNL